MPLLDVTEILDDPEFATTFDVKRPMITVGDTGRGVENDQLFPGVVGVVEAAGFRDLQLLPEGQFQKGTIAIYTTFILSSGTRVDEADIVTWKGTDYTVMNVDDWSEWGAGFVRATASVRVGTTT